MPKLDSQRAQSLGYRIARLFRAAAKNGDRLFARHPVKHSQIPLFMEVIHQPGRSQMQLAQVLHLDKAAVARKLFALEKADFISRCYDPQCRRDKLVYPTEQAEELLPQTLDLLETFNELLFQGFSPEERQNALQVVDRLIVNLERVLDEEES